MDQSNDGSEQDPANNKLKTLREKVLSLEIENAIKRHELQDPMHDELKELRKKNHEHELAIAALSGKIKELEARAAEKNLILVDPRVPG